MTVYLTLETTLLGSWQLRMPDHLTYNDGKEIIKLNLWNNQFIYDAGKTTENIMIDGFETDKTTINNIDTAMDEGEEITISGFGNTDLDTIWLCESFSYTRDDIGGYSYIMQLEKV